MISPLAMAFVAGWLFRAAIHQASQGEKFGALISGAFAMGLVWTVLS